MQVGAQQATIPTMQGYLFIGGNQDSLTIPLGPDVDIVQMPAGVTGKDNYIAETLTVGDAAISIYRHESLTSEQAIDRIIEHYKAWAASRPGGRR